MAGASCSRAGPGRSSSSTQKGDHMDQSSGDRLDAARQGEGIVRQRGQGFRRAVGRGQGQGVPGGAAWRQGVGQLHQHDQAPGVEERHRHPAGHRAARRDGDLHRALGPSRPLRRGQGRRHLQRRARQCGGRRRADRARRGAGEGRAGQAQHGVHVGHRRGIGAARVQILCRAPGLSARQDRRRGQHGRAQRDRAVAGTSSSPASASPSSRI